MAAGRGHAEVHVLNVAKEVTTHQKLKETEVAGVTTLTTHTETVLDKLENMAQDAIDAMLERDPQRSFNRIVTHFRVGKPAPMLIQLAVDLDADVIVVGTHNRTGIKRLVMGSVAETVVHQARCPVVVVRKKDHLELGDVPEVEPPCKACMDTRAASNGAEMWCARHALAKYRPRVHRVMRGANRGEAEPWSQATPEV